MSHVTITEITLQWMWKS